MRRQPAAFGPNRRAFNASLLALGLGALLPKATRAASGGFLATGYDKLQSRHLVTRLGDDFEILWDLALPARGHGTSVRPGMDEGIVVARRPGRYALVFGLEDGAQRHLLTPAPGRHFYGHGVYSPDGALLWMTENDFAAARGVIGVYDARAGYARIGEFPSGGTGPHQALLKADGHTLAVANGGIQTHPDSGREKLNIPSMRPSLADIDTRTGKITAQSFFTTERLQKLSIRHMALTSDDRVVVGCQDQINDGQELPLVYIRHTTAGGLTPLQMPDGMLGRFDGYCGSVVFDAPSRTLAVSSPRGGLVGFWRLPEGKWQGHVELADGCGLAANTGGVVMSSGDGTVESLDTALSPVRSDRHAFRQWDNHMTALHV